MVNHRLRDGCVNRKPGSRNAQADWLPAATTDILWPADRGAHLRTLLAQRALELMHRWIARFLLLAMLGPSLGQVAMAALPVQAPHCMRKPLQAAMMQAGMPCHHGAAIHPASQSSETSFRAAGDCCQNHDCCCRMGGPRWAHTRTVLLSQQCLLMERSVVAPRVAFPSTGATGSDPARAPPRV